MKFATIVHLGQPVCVVLMGDGGLSPLSTIRPELNGIRDLLLMDENSLRDLEVAAASGKGQISVSSAHWIAPVPDPPQMLFVALNNSGLDRDLVYRPDFPAYFPKLPSALNGHGQPIDLYPHYGLTHPEAELGIVIGRGGRHIPLDSALGHVFGYTVVNDVTSVGMRKEDAIFGKQLMPSADGGFKLKEEHFLYQGRYKNADGFAPMGPFVVHKSHIADPMNLQVRAWIDDELVADDDTSSYHFTVAEVVSWISHHSTLRTGDIISLGTALNPVGQMKPLSHGNINERGEVVRVEIEGVGILSNPVRRLPLADPREHFFRHKRFRSRLAVEESAADASAYRQIDRPIN
jgi:2-keto-4-pentenoate hydratase/2-oxohepta-3-ene-1,7-dioic acid hydratase in catechol pathway